VDIHSADKMRGRFKNKKLMQKQREIVYKLFLSAQTRAYSFNENGF